jgi:hypothetical protein
LYECIVSQFLTTVLFYFLHFFIITSFHPFDKYLITLFFLGHKGKLIFFFFIIFLVNFVICSKHINSDSYAEFIRLEISNPCFLYWAIFLIK